VNRREFLRGAAGAWLVACSSKSGSSTSSSGSPPPPPPPPCSDALAGGAYVEDVAILSAGTAPLDTPTGLGLDGRLYGDLSKLAQGTAVTPTEHFYIRTRYPDLIDPNAAWKISVGGLVAAPFDLTLDDLAAREKPMGVHLLECSGNGDFSHFGMLSAADWAGVPLYDLLQEKASALGQATRVNVSGFDQYSTPHGANSEPGASWIIALDDLKTYGAFLATKMNGAPLTPDHGFPVRLMIPGWYGCACAKWVNEITLVDDTAPATSQMTEYATRTNQNGTPQLAKDYVPATIDQAAMPVRVEKWRLNGALVYNIVGVMWGGSKPTDALMIRFNPDLPFEKVDVCPQQTTNTTWTWWSHVFRPPAPGTYEMLLKVDDPTILQRRMATGFYARKVAISEV
jgi:DMSO/TMAO reductase YedYZ molybdopterin-dependent catalytic subunit